jgi:hypothetical protein
VTRVLPRVLAPALQVQVQVQAPLLLLLARRRPTMRRRS